MLQDLQYLTGTSMAVGGAEGSEEGDQDLTIVQSERLGPMARGSVSEASWGWGWMLRGRMPGSEKDACRKDERQI